MLEGAPHGGLYFAFSGVDFLSEQSRYFRVFAHLSKYRAGRALAAQLPPEILATTSEAATTARETKAIRDLIFATRFPESI